MSVRYGGLTNLRTEVFIFLLLCIALPQLVFVLFSVLGKLIGLAWHPALTVGNGIGNLVGATISLAALYGMTFGWKQLTVKQVDLTFDNLPSEFEGYRIAQLSDLHVGSYGSRTAFLEKVVRTVNEAQPDLIFFTGDLINTSPDEITPFEHFLSAMRAKDGVMSVLGNHDYSLYGMKERPADPREGAVKVVEAERRIGWDLLLNEHRILTRNGAQIAVIGVENTGKPPFPEIGDLHGSLAGLSDSTFKILLSHDPSHWRMEVLPTTDIPLMLAGHTHAAQVKIGSWSPVQWMYKEWSGLYQEGSQQLYISEGVGGTIPFRLGTKPEIIVFTLHRNTAKS
ncbi:MAG: metallophosphoesterase [Bacteroidales bacterium]|nr:metallophosphoesterase [Bacteroidales bacterium]